MPKARNMIIDGYKKGTQLQRDQYCLFYMFNGKNPIDKTMVKSYQILSEETSRDTASTVGRGLLGSMLFGHAGATAALTARENKIYTIKIDWDPNSSYGGKESSILELDSDFYQTFMLKCARTEEDQKKFDRIDRMLHPEKYAQETKEAVSDTAPDTEDTRAKLKELKALFEEELITEEEYQSKRQEILSKM